MGKGTLTSYAEVEEPPKHEDEYDETYVVLEDHLRPDCPVEEPGVRRVSEPPVVKRQETFWGSRTSFIRVYTLFHEPMARNLMVCYHVGEVGRSLDHSHRPQRLTRKHYYNSWVQSL